MTARAYFTSPRRVLDQYDTPPWQVDALVDHVPAIQGVVWEPCAGDGSLLARLMERQGGAITGMLTVDADPERQPMIVGDATDPKQWGDWVRAHGSPEWVVTNPPFTGAYEILQCAVAHATVGVAFLSRLSFVEPTRRRGQWLHDHPHDQRIVLERWSYTGNGRTDASTTEWLIFVKDWRILTPPFGISAHGYRPR